LFRIRNEEGSGKQEGVQYEWFTSVSVYADYINLLGENTQTAKKHNEALLVDRK
jgi:hypothetical protein